LRSSRIPNGRDWVRTGRISSADADGQQRRGIEGKRGDGRKIPGNCNTKVPTPFNAEISHKSQLSLPPPATYPAKLFILFDIPACNAIWRPAADVTVIFPM
jgi:hypothetical protein